MNSTTLFRLLFAAFLLCFLLVGCGQSTQDIGQVVKTSMQEKFTSDTEFKKWNLIVRSVDIVKQGENKFQGLAHIEYKGTTHDVPVDVSADGSNVIWKTEPGAFLFVVQDELKELQKQFD